MANKNPIDIFVVIHDDINPSIKQQMAASYFSHLQKELESFTDRKVNIFYGTGSPHNKFDYKGSNETEILQRWEKLGLQWLEFRSKEGFIITQTSLVLLFTAHPINENVSGAALVDLRKNGGRFAIASAGSNLYPAHEIGHLLGAKHDDYEVNYDGWWCETYMTPNPHLLRSNCYKYSPANRNAIKHYLASMD
ncbi:hypothetical protein [Pseudomonas sp. S2_C03]